MPITRLKGLHENNSNIFSLFRIKYNMAGRPSKRQNVDNGKLSPSNAALLPIYLDNQNQMRGLYAVPVSGSRHIHPRCVMRLTMHASVHLLFADFVACRRQRQESGRRPLPSRRP